MRTLLTVLTICLLSAGSSHATMWTVNNVGFTFSPASITIALGDSVNFVLDPSHDAREVDQATWNANGNTSNGGFQTPLGGGVVVITALGMHWYVCSIHAAFGMKGTINVTPQVPISITISSLSKSVFCPGDALSVTYATTGNFAPGNVFTAQLSNNAGGFGSPAVIGTFGSTGGGSIPATIPIDSPFGTGYRIRVVSSSPPYTSADNGTDLTINSLPTATITAGGSTTFCQGGYVMLNANTGTGFTYVWRRNTAPIAGAMQASYMATLSGSYSVDVINASGCIATSAPVTVTVEPFPTALITPSGPTTFCVGGSVTLTANLGAGLTYQWMKNSQILPAETGTSYLATDAGIYTVVVSNAGGCATTSPGVAVSVAPLDPTRLVWSGAISGNWNDAGNWNSPCAIPTPGDTVIIGTAAVLPTGIPSMSLSQLVINTGTDIPLLGDVTVTGNLALTSGRLLLGSHVLRIEAGATITGMDASHYVVTDAAGVMTYAGLGASGRTGTVIYPVGTMTSYLPVTFSNSGTMDDFSVRVSGTVLDGGTSGAAIASNVVNATWFISEPNPGGANATAGFQWNQSDEAQGFDRALSFVSHYDGINWRPLDAPASPNGTGPYQRIATGVTTFSPFAIGDIFSPLPVELATFEAKRLSDAVALDWTVAAEHGLNGYTVQRRESDIGEWIPIGFVPAADQTAYHYLDLSAGSSTLFYRLEMTDNDGTTRYSPVVSVSSQQTASMALEVSLYPNPVNAEQGVVVQVTSPVATIAHITLHDVSGRELEAIADGPVDALYRTSFTVPTANLPSGHYYIRVVAGSRAAVTKLSVLR